MIEALFSFIPLFALTETISDLVLALKIFVLLSIASFVWNHIGRGFLATVLIIGIAWFVLVDYWKFFGGIYLLWVLLTLGISGVIVDFFFVSQMGPEEVSANEPSPVSSGIDLANRMYQIQRARQVAGGMFRKRGPPR